MDKNFFTVLLEDYPGYLAMGVFVVIIGAIGGAKLFAKAIRNTHEHRSISALFMEG